MDDVFLFLGVMGATGLFVELITGVFFFKPIKTLAAALFDSTETLVGALVEAAVFVEAGECERVMSSLSDALTAVTELTEP